MCNTSNLADGYIFKILDLNIPTRDSHQCRNALEYFLKRDPNGEGFIADGRGAWFVITDIYETTTHKDLYLEVEFQKIASIKFFDKTPMKPQLLLSLTIPSPPSVNMSTPVGRQKR